MKRKLYYVLLSAMLVIESFTIPVFATESGAPDGQEEITVLDMQTLETEESDTARVNEALDGQMEIADGQESVAEMEDEQELTAETEGAASLAEDTDKALLTVPTLGLMKPSDRKKARELTFGKKLTFTMTDKETEDVESEYEYIKFTPTKSDFYTFVIKLKHKTDPNDGNFFAGFVYYYDKGWDGMSSTNEIYAIDWTKEITSFGYLEKGVTYYLECEIRSHSGEDPNKDSVTVEVMYAEDYKNGLIVGEQTEKTINGQSTQALDACMSCNIGDDVEIKVNASVKKGSVHYEWFTRDLGVDKVDYQPVSDVTGNTFKIENIQKSTGVKCNISDDTGYMFSREVWLFVDDGKEEVHVDVPKPAATSIKKLKAKKRAVVISWKKGGKNVKGYHIQVSTSKKFKNAEDFLIYKKSTTKATIKKMKSKKKYYFRIRTYNQDPDTYDVSFSKWSAKKSIKVK